MQALKHYFLIDRGDVIISFLDTAEDEMAKPKHAVSLPRLQTLLELGTPLCITNNHTLCVAIYWS